MVLTGKRFNDITMSQAKLKDALASFQPTHFVICLEQRRHHWAPCVISQRDYFKMNNIFLEGGDMN
jgi:hypothetical protein